MEILNTIVEMLPTILVLVIFVIAGIVYLRGKKNSVQDWLIYAVTLAEKMYGGGTGKLKLREVYNNFIKTFPHFSALISFETFSEWVDVSLVTMKEYIETNPAIANVIEGDTITE